MTAGNPGLAQRGKLVLLLHGFPANASEWQPELERLAAEGYYAVAPNQRGFSPRARPTSAAAYVVDNMVNDALAIASAVGAQQFHLVGHDWGGVVAWRVAAAAPSRVRSLTVLSTPHQSALVQATLDFSNGQLGRLLYYPVFASEGFADLLGAFDGYFLIESLKSQGLPEAAARNYYDYLKAPGALNAALAWYRSNPLTLTDDTKPVTVPTTYVWGDREFAFGPEAAQLTGRYVKAPYTFRVLSGIGHWVPETASGVVSDLIVRQVRAAS